MRSTLITHRKRSCPLCGHLGFARTGTDFYGNAVFECNACRHEWSSDRGPQRGTSRHRNATKPSGTSAIRQRGESE